MSLRSPLLEATIEPFSRGVGALQERISVGWYPGQHWCITGATGSGKTSLLQLFSGQIFSPHAQISYPLVNEWKLRHPQKRFIADWLSYVPQEARIPSPYFIDDLYHQRRFQSAEQAQIPTVYSILENAASSSDQTWESVAEQMRLTDLMYQPFIQLSNGQTRRLMIALALIQKPAVLFLDNPYTGLDQPSRMELNHILQQLAEQGTHIMMAALPHEVQHIPFITDILQLDKQHSFEVAPKTNLFSCPSSKKEEIIRMKDFSVGYGKKVVLQNLHWEVQQGEHWVISGKNGSGKSTLLSVIMGDHPQSYAHEWYLFGRKRGSGESIWDIKRHIGYFSPELLRFMDKSSTVQAIILSGLYDLPRAFTPRDHEQAQGLSQWLDIGDWLERPFAQLSFGEQRIVLLARAMVRNPKLLILDEPLQGLDLQWREWLKALLVDFCRNRTTLYITHDEQEIPEGEWKVLELS